MSQKPRSSGFETPSPRLKKRIKPKPYTAVKIKRGLYLLYRRNEVIGAWIVRVCHEGQEWTRKIADADDREPANGRDILDYWQAIDECKLAANAGKLTTDNTVRAAMDAYKANLEDRGKDPDNVGRVLAYLPDKLADKHVATLTDDDLKPFRDELLANMKPNSAKRTIRAFNAAMTLAANRDRVSRRPWNGALKIEDSSDPSHNVILDDHDQRAVIAAAHRYSEPFGLFVEILRETGSRPSQVARLTAGNVQANFVDPRTKQCLPRLLMPVSRKGRGTKQITHRPVPISEGLADRLAKLESNRTALLFKDADGASWLEISLPWRFDCATREVKFNNPDKVTAYSLRHTSVVRQLLAGVPTAVVARLHDTSVAMVEKHYSAYIADHTDGLARATLPKPAEIVSLDTRRA